MHELESRTMRMSLQTMPKWAYACVFITFFLAFSTTLIVGYFVGPREVLKTLCFPVNAPCEATDLTMTAWEKSLVNLDKLNQQMFVRINVTNPIPAISGAFQATFLAYPVAFDGVPPKDNPDMNKTTTRVVKCQKDAPFCDPLYLLHYDFVAHTNYTVHVSAPGAEASSPLRSSYIAFSYVDDKFTLFELWFRFAFLLLTFATIVLFAHKLRRYRWSDWQVEQKWTAFILFGLMAADNPFFALELIVDSAFPVFFDQVMLVTFIAMLLFFWLVMFDGVRKDAVQRTMLKFYAPKVLLVGLFWLTTLVVFSIYELRSLSDAQYSEVRDDPNFMFFLVGELILAVLYVFWMVYIVCRACSEARTFPLLGMRLRFFALFTLLVVGIMLSGFILQFFEPTTAVSGSTMALLSYLALYNYYVYVLAFVYLPSRHVVRTSTKDQIGMVRFEDDVDEPLEEEIDH